MDEQSKQIQRVRRHIARWVHQFCGQVYAKPGRRFRGSELCEYVAAYAAEQGGTVAPESALRILRDLRKRQVVEVENVDRANSVYEVTTVRPLDYVPPPPEPPKSFEPEQLDFSEVG